MFFTEMCKNHMRTVGPIDSLTIISEPLRDSFWKNLNPSELFKSLAGRPDLAWLDSAQFDKAGNSWSYILLRPDKRFEVYRSKVLTFSNGSQPSVQKPLTASQISRLLKPNYSTQSKHADAPPFCGGWVGYVGYDALRLNHNIAETGDAFPHMALNLFTSVLAYSHQQKCWWAGATTLSATSEDQREYECRNRIKLLVEQIAPMQDTTRTLYPAPQKRICVSNCKRSEYEQKARRALEYIRSGDVYQINLAQRLRVPWESSPELLYLRLRQESPAKYGAFLGSGLVAAGKSICSISPELYLQVNGREVLSRPIKGTRPRGIDSIADSSACKDLDNSSKERAELNMIVDLVRNDLGRVCEYASVSVLSAGEIEELPTLLHRVATIKGRLKPGCSAASLLRATFPGGSVTGAPKIRAMQIIDELEASPRGPYCGAIGWLGLDGNMELSIAIRTALCDASECCAYYHAGSGIVADSSPQLEYEETLHKAAAFFRATNSVLSSEFRQG